MVTKKKKAAAPKSKKVGKTSQAKLKKARNECCPVLAIECALVAPKAKRKFVAVSDRYAFEHPSEKLVKHGNKMGKWADVSGAPVKKCTVKVGGRKAFYGDAEDAGRKLAAVKKALHDRRCCATVTSNSGTTTSCPR